MAVKIAKILGCEVVSADSMQVYKGMDILAAIPTNDEMQGIRHHLIGFVPCTDRFNASKYRSCAQKALDEITERNRIPLLCGGTGLYIDALTRGIRMAEEADDEYREELKKIASEPGGERKLYEMLLKADPESAQKYPCGDVRRVIRSLEIVHTTGKTRGEYEKADRERKDDYRCMLFALKWNREDLYERIGKRVDEMVGKGLVQEVERLMSTDSTVQETAAQAIGFKEIRLALEEDRFEAFYEKYAVLLDKRCVD